MESGSQPPPSQPPPPTQVPPPPPSEQEPPPPPVAGDEPAAEQPGAAAAPLDADDTRGIHFRRLATHPVTLSLGAVALERGSQSRDAAWGSQVRLVDRRRAEPPP